MKKVFFRSMLPPPYMVCLIRAPAWGAMQVSSRKSVLRSFQSAHPRGVRYLSSGNPEKRGKFQSAHPRGVRSQARTLGGTHTRFNPRTHEGCDDRDRLSDGLFVVSIRAPTRGAISLRSSPRRDSMVSIRAPTRGAIAHDLL